MQRKSYKSSYFSVYFQKNKTDSSTSGIRPLKTIILLIRLLNGNLKHVSKILFPIFSFIFPIVSFSCLQTACPRSESTLNELAEAGYMMTMKKKIDDSLNNLDLQATTVRSLVRLSFEVLQNEKMSMQIYKSCNSLLPATCNSILPMLQ